MASREDGLRAYLKGLFKEVEGSPLSISWVESPSTSPGIPDLSYCHKGIEGWLELKAGPKPEIRVTQERWFEERIEAGGRPLILAQWGQDYMIIPGSRISALRRRPVEETFRRLATTSWHRRIPVYSLLKVMISPEQEYEDSRRNSEGTGVGVRAIR